MVVAFHPGRGVGDQGEARGVAFGEAVLAEAADLFEDALGELALDALGAHPLHQALAVALDAAGAAPGGHVAA